MKRVTITLPDDMADALNREARRQGTSASAVAREALAARLWLGGCQARPLPFAALGRSGERDTARRVGELVDGAWEVHATGSTRARPCSSGSDDRS